jgi:phosphoribosylformylglycinamidine (FGAM) synthase-like enzyme
MKPPTNSPADLLTSLAAERDWLSALQRLLCTSPALQPAHLDIPTSFQRAGASLVLAQPLRTNSIAWTESFGATAFSRIVLKKNWGRAEEPDAKTSDALHAVVQRLVDAKFLHSACVIGHGGVAVALAQAARVNALGARVNMFQPEYHSALHAYFSEAPTRLLLSCDTHAHLALANFIERTGRFIAMPLGRVHSSDFSLSWEGERVIHAPEASSI